jgi:hypothetical protein
MSELKNFPPIFFSENVSKNHNIDIKVYDGTEYWPNVNEREEDMQRRTV